MQELEFDLWYDLLRDALKILGTRQAPDRQQCYSDYAQQKTPDQSAKLFFEDWHPDTIED